MMLVFESPWIARNMAAKFTPVVAMRPMPNVVPVPSSGLALDGLSIDWASEARFTPPTGCWNVPSGASAVVVRPHGPVHAELGVLVHVDVDDDGFDEHLHAADVEFVDHAHERAHDLGGRGDDQRVGLRLRPDGGGAIGAGGDAARGATARRRRAGGDGHGRADLFLELGGDLFRVGELQVTNLRVAAAFERRVEMRDQRLDAQAQRFFAADQHAVGAVVGDDARRRAAAAFGLALLREEGVHHAHDFAGRGVLQVDDVDVVVALLVDALDDAHHAAHVAGAVREDEDVAVGIGGHVRGLRHQRTQHRHELRGIHVVDRDDLRDQLIGARLHARGQVDVRHLPRVGVRHDLDDAAGFHGDELVHRQQREERFVERVRASSASATAS